MTHDPSRYGDDFASDYDERYPAVPAGAPEIAFLTENARGGPVLELGIGTGRLALPLVAAGLEVHGIDASPRMVERLRAKPGGASIPVAIGDFRDVPASRNDFALVFVAFNTFFALLTQEDQVAALRAAAARIRAGGCFVIEAFVPDLTRFDRGQCVRTMKVLPEGLRIEASLHDPVHQRIDTRDVTIDAGRIRTLPISIRYAWPSELDLMARLAGLELEARYASWGKAPFSSGSAGHVSVYRKAGR